MQFNFTVSGLEGTGVSVWDAGALVRLSSVEFHKLRNVLEQFGQCSAVAQGLRAPITDIWRLRSTDQLLYLQTAAAPSGSCTVLGGLKVGKKKLFMHRSNGSIVEIEPLCVLDFYVHEDHQRQGVGRALFEFMLQAHQATAEQLGYDRPSSKLLAFLWKHYGLANFIPQANKFVVYEQYFNTMLGPGSRGSRPGATTSGGGGSWGATVAAANCYGNGRQTLHVLGSRAAAEAGPAAPAPAEQWVPTSQRPPTAALQHCVHLQAPQAAAGSTMGGCQHQPCSPTSHAHGAAWSALGGPGCPTAGKPTERHQPHQNKQQHTAGSGGWEQQQQQQALLQEPAVQYGRGRGMRDLRQLQEGPAGASNGHVCFQQAVLAGAANPAPPRPVAGPLPPWQQQQQQGSWITTDHTVSRGDSCRDSLDRFVAAAGPSSSGGGSSMSTGSTFGGFGPPSSGSQDGCVPPPPLQQQQHQKGQATYSSSAQQSQTQPMRGSCNHAHQQQQQQPYVLVPPFACLEPKPGTLLPSGCSEVDHMSLRRQAALQAQQHMHQQIPAWVTAGAGPPGKLMQAPLASYAVATAGMAGVLGGGMGSSGRGQWDTYAGSSVGGDSEPRSRQHRQQQQPNPLCLSWDGLLPPGVARSPVGGCGPAAHAPWQSTQQQLTSRNTIMQAEPEGIYHESRAAAATHRAGSGAASCLRMV